MDILAGIGFALAVQRQVLAVLGFQDRRQQLRPGAATGDRVEWRGWLRDGLAGAADELLAHGLDDLPLPRDHLQRLGHALAQPGQRAVAAGAGGRARDHHALTRQMGGQRSTHRSGPGSGAPGTADRFRLSGLVLRAVCLQFLELQLELVEQAAAALRGRAEPVALQPGDHQLEVGDHRLGTRGPRLGLVPGRALGHQRGAQRVDVVGQRLGVGHHPRIQSRPEQLVYPRSPSASRVRSPRALQISPVDPVQHVSEL